MPNDRFFETTGIDVGAMRSILFADALPEIAAFYNAPEDAELGPRNLESIRQTIAQKFEWRQAALGSLPIREKMNAIARAKVFISHDDNNEITNSIWMPKDSLIIILLNGTSSESDAVQFLRKSGRTIHLIPGKSWSHHHPLSTISDELEEGIEFPDTGGFDSDIEVLERVIGNLSEE
jgi:hypothetical protein